MNNLYLNSPIKKSNSKIRENNYDNNKNNNNLINKNNNNLININRYRTIETNNENNN